MRSGSPLADKLWGDHDGEQQGVWDTIHSHGMEQPRSEHQQPLVDSRYAVALKATAPIAFNPAKAQGTQKRLETLELPLKPVHYLLIRGNTFGLLWPLCSRTLGYSVPCPGDPTSLHL